MSDRFDFQDGPDLTASSRNGGAGSREARRTALLDEPGAGKTLAGTSRPLSARAVAAAHPGPRPGTRGEPFAEPFAEELDSVCEGVARLAATAGRAPSRIRLQVGLTSVEVEWPEAAHAPGAAAAGIAHAGATATVTATATTTPAAPAGQAGEPAGIAHVCAPTVGTFYHRPSPDAEPFVRPGDHVAAGQPVGVIEVMKMMSTITADVAGRVVDLLVPDGHPVEFGEHLIALDTTSAGG